ncbi:hypothetical protein IGI04_038342 [Brassica rapa subsp. trilocularis]|uniref:Uncharacterized protein n=1 Tax=Brassica rapa subsp. trilocularis TaxID=1813537 RepID=A0ABQ7LK03_BRACM|nr:hypothetical protein IGI04_038342 [Brassica rapa subsp. trilocularis]
MDSSRRIASQFQGKRNTAGQRVEPMEPQLGGASSAYLRLRRGKPQILRRRKAPRGLAPPIVHWEAKIIQIELDLHKLWIWM